jgi:signal transduction histidine kinase
VASIGSMRVTQPLFQIRRIPPGVWTAVIWCASVAYSLRVHLGIPGWANVPGGVRPAVWLMLALAAMVAVAGSALLRRRPLPGLGLVIAGSVIDAVGRDSPMVVLADYLAADVAMGFIVAGRSRVAGIAALAMAVGVLPGYAIVRAGLGLSYAQSPGWEVYVLTAVVAWLAGNSVRTARGYAERLRAHAAAEAVTAERLRISRELHDMVAHSMGIIALQAGAAARVIDTQPQRARDALHEVEIASRETLAGLRQVLGAIHRAEPGPGPGAPREPVPGLADVERLAVATTTAGVRVDVRWRGERCPLPPDVELAAYRIIQEAVTNVIRHAGTSSCQVLIEHQEEQLAIEIADSGPGHGADAGSGRGLAGMRERAALLGGDLTAGPQPEGGFRVTARLPVPAKDDSS